MKKTTLTMALLLLTGQSAFANNQEKAAVWEKITTVNSSEYFINLKSLKMTSDAPTVIESTVKQVALASSGDLKAGETKISKISYNCDANAYQLGITSKYNKLNKLTYQMKEEDRVYTFFDVGDSKVYGPLQEYACSTADALRLFFEPEPIGDYTGEGI